MMVFRFTAYLIDGDIQEGYCEGIDEYQAERDARSKLIACANSIEIY